MVQQMVKKEQKPISGAFSQWLAEVRDAMLWTHAGDSGPVIAVGLAAGSKEAMPDADKYDALIAQARQLKAAAERGEGLPAQKSKERQRWRVRRKRRG